MRVVLVGFGRIGSRLTEKLLKDKMDLVVVDQDPKRAELAEATYGIQGIPGNATQERVLETARAGTADAVITTSRSDPVNLMVCSLAKRLGAKHVVSIVNEPEGEPIFEAEGITVVKNASHITAEYLYHAFELPGIRTFMPLGEEGKVVTTIVHAGSELVGRTVQDAGFGKDVLIAAIRRGGRVILPRGTTRLESGDLITAVAGTGRVETFLNRVTSATGLDIIWKKGRLPWRK